MFNSTGIELTSADGPLRINTAENLSKEKASAQESRSRFQEVDAISYRSRSWSLGGVLPVTGGLKGDFVSTTI